MYFYAIYFQLENRLLHQFEWIDMLDYHHLKKVILTEHQYYLRLCFLHLLYVMYEGLFELACVYHEKQ